MNKEHHMSLDSQFTVVLDGIIYFSVRFCNNSLVVLKMHFQVFSVANKKVQGFSSDRKILMSLLSVLSNLQKRFLKFQFLAKIFGEKFIMSLKSTSFPTFYLPDKTN